MAKKVNGEVGRLDVAFGDDDLQKLLDEHSIKGEHQRVQEALEGDVAKSPKPSRIPRTKKGEGGEDVAVVVSAPKFEIAEFRVRGTAPLVMNRFGQKAIEQIMATQMAGQQSRSRKVREPKDFDALFHGARHLSEEGWDGIPAPAFRNAMIRACSLVGYKMTQAKMTVFCLADGLDKVDGMPLVRLIAGEPERHIGPVRNESGVVDIRARPMWRKWMADVRIRFDRDQFSRNDVTNLLLRAGIQVGLCEGRPASSNSNGLDWGTFEIVGI